MSLGRPPAGLSYWHPATLLATWGWSGLLPGAPGTWGSLFTLPFAWLIAWQWGPLALVPATVVVLAVGLWASRIYLRHGKSKDPGDIVIDETAGQLLTLAVVPVDLWWYAAGFMLFRIADIIKPWPASWADCTLPGALGVMTDDIFAAIYAIIVLYAAQMIVTG